VREEGGRVREGERDKKKEKLCLDIMKTNEENIGAQESAQTEYIPVHSCHRELSITLFFHPASFPTWYFEGEIQALEAQAEVVYDEAALVID
jgi:hypothetical protein